MGIRENTVLDQGGESWGSERRQLGIRENTVGIREETVGDQGGDSWGSERRQ